jgi:4-amino-4-deoxy-L-arabinose transferase-like glycosyltransferase
MRKRATQKRRRTSDPREAKAAPERDRAGWNQPKSWPPWAIGAAAALAVRFLYLATANGPAFTDPLIDADYYDYLGTRLAAGEGFETGAFWQPPLYPLFVALLYALFEPSLVIVRVAQALIGAGVAAMTADLAERASGERRSGLIAGLLVALCGPMVFYDGELLPTSLATALGMLGLWIALRGDPTPKTALGSGAAIGLAALAVAAVGAMIVPAAWAAWRARRGYALLCVAACAGAILPVTLVNRARSGEWVAISANAGVNLWIGNNADADRTIAVRPGKDWEELVNEPIARGAASAGQADAYFARKAGAWCTSEPIACVGGLLRKARLLLAARELPRNENIDLLKHQSPVLELLFARAGGVALPYVLLLPLAAAGIAHAVRSRSRVGIGLCIAVLALALVPVIFFVAGRYRAPIAPALCALAALGVEAFRARSSAPLFASAAALLLAVLPVQTAADGVDFEAEMHYAVAGRRARRGDAEGAVAGFRKALERRPGYVEARSNLALELEKLQRPREAAAEYRELLPQHPNPAAIELRLAITLLESGDHAAAEQHFLRVLAREPDNATAAAGLHRARSASAAGPARTR